MATYNKTFSEEAWTRVNEKNKLIMEDFLMEYKQQRKKASTIQQYFYDSRIIMIYILQFCDNRCILELKKKDFRRFSLWLMEDCGVSSARSNRLMSACRSMLDFCENDDEYEYEQNFAAKVKGVPNVAVRDICFLTDEEVTGLIDDLVEKEDYQRATLISLFYDSAGRKNEVFQVTKQSFLDEKSNCTNIVTGKRGKKFPLLYFSRTKKLAKLYLDQRGEDKLDTMWVLIRIGDGAKKEASVDSIYNWTVALRDTYRELFPDGRSEEFSCHSFRHAALENFSTGDHYVCKELGMEDGFPLDKLKLIANHESIETTASYLKNKDHEILEEMFGINLEG